MIYFWTFFQTLFFIIFESPWGYRSLLPPWGHLIGSDPFIFYILGQYARRTATQRQRRGAPLTLRGGCSHQRTSCGMLALCGHLALSSPQQARARRWLGANTNQQDNRWREKTESSIRHVWGQIVNMQMSEALYHYARDRSWRKKANGLHDGVGSIPINQ